MRARFFSLLNAFVIRWPKAIVLVGILLTVASAGFAAKTIVLNADLDDLVSEDLEYHRRYKDFLKEFGDQEYLYVVVEAGQDPSSSKQFIVSLAKRLTTIPDLKEITWKISNPALEQGFLLYLKPQDLTALKTTLSEGPLALNKIASWARLGPVFHAARKLSEASNAQNEQTLALGFGLLDRVLGAIQTTLEGKPQLAPSLAELFSQADQHFDADGFIRSGELFFVMIMPEKDFTTMEVIAKPLSAIRQAIDATKKEYPQVVAGLTGRPVLAADELATTNRDSTIATIIAFVLVGLLFIGFFRSLANPFLAMVALAMGMSWTFGFVALAFGQLTILSTVFAMILIGAAVEYAIHLVARYQEELAARGDVQGALLQMLQSVAPANLTSALTTAAAFAMIMWTDFTALSELGAIAAVGIILCLIAIIVILPAMMFLKDRSASQGKIAKVHPLHLPGLTRVYRHRTLLILVSLALTGALLPFAWQVHFDHNLLNLQAKGLESVAFEQRIIEKSAEATWFANVVGRDKKDLKQKAEAFRNLSSVRRVEDLSTLIPEHQDEKLVILRDFAAKVGRISFSPASAVVDRMELLQALGQFQGAIEVLIEKAFAAGRLEATQELEHLSRKLERVTILLQGASTDRLFALGKLQQGFLADLHRHAQMVLDGLSASPIKLDDLPLQLRGRFISPNGNLALTIYPKEDIWDPAALERFVAELRSVDPHVLGTPIEVYESSKLMQETFVRSAILAFLVIVFLVWLDFRSLKATAMAIFPLVVGMLWLVGCMGLFGIPFNMANFFAVPILIGVAVDNGVHVLHRIRGDRSLEAIGTSTGNGLIVTAFSNAIGFGAMMIGHHRGLVSFGQIMTIGSLCCILTSLFVMPPITSFVLRIPYRNIIRENASAET
ncbi:MAG: MMPL family transporter [Deltaproteobacteria bacterium]|nr:MMPL family transporter [Deltaproteobacteria bacterium]